MFKESFEFLLYSLELIIGISLKKGICMITIVKLKVRMIIISAGNRREK